MKKGIFTSSVAFVAVLAFSVVGTKGVFAGTVNHTITIEEPILGIEIEGSTENAYTLVRGASGTIIASSPKLKIKNTGNIIATIYAKVQSVPVGLNLSTTSVSAPGDFEVTNYIDDLNGGWVSDKIGLTDTFVGTNELPGTAYLQPALSMNVVTAINIAATTPAGTYNVPIEWTAKPE